MFYKDVAINTSKKFSKKENYNEISTSITVTVDSDGTTETTQSGDNPSLSEDNTGLYIKECLKELGDKEYQESKDRWKCQ